ncbi:MAG: LacI family DNA-binding transcriptional regulator, partial [Propionibacteriaceae bacterium]
MAKRATLADVAERSGMSRTAVSLALNQVPNSRLSSEAIERIHQAAAELDYRPNPAARSLRVGKTATIAFLSDNVTVTRYASAMIRGLLDVAETEDHTVLIAETGDTPARIGKALKAMLDRRPDAVVFGLMGAKEIDVPKLPSDLPVVLLNSTSPQGHACVLPDEFQGGRDIARTLAEAGHRRVAIIGHDDGLIQNLRLSTTMR